MERSRKRYHIRSTFRFTIFLTILFMVSIFAIGSLISVSNAESIQHDGYLAIKVESGDTLWDIAQKFGPQDMDTREVVYQICKFNDIRADQLQAGMTVLIPEQI